MHWARREERLRRVPTVRAVATGETELLGPEPVEAARPSRRLQEYVEALEGHVTGLEHNIEVLTTALTESDQRYRSVLNSRAMRMTAPLRWLRRTVRLGGRTS